MEKLVDQLRMEKHRLSTKKNYYGIWKCFNEFFLKLDRKPKTWEDRLVLFVGHLIDTNKKSSTIKSYISAIKSVLMDDGVELHEDKYLLSSLTRACRYKNDGMRIRLPLQKGLLNLMLDSAVELFLNNNQVYLYTMYCALFISAYYGLMRVGELTTGNHPILATDVHIGENKRKILFILRTSKTHWLDNKPQQIKISAKEKGNIMLNEKHCPFSVLIKYIQLRGNCKNRNEPFFIFRDRQPVKPSDMRSTMKKLLTLIGVTPSYYGTHSLRIGRSVDLLKMNFSVETIRKIGRWRSSAVYAYLR